MFLPEQVTSLVGTQPFSSHLISATLGVPVLHVISHLVFNGTMLVGRFGHIFPFVGITADVPMQYTIMNENNMVKYLHKPNEYYK